MIFLSTLLLSIFVTMALIPAFSRLAGRLHAMDVPDWRKVHGLPIPRTGGLAMAIGTFVSAFLWMRSDSFLHAYLIGAGIIVMLGILDDTRGADYRVKFVGQVAAALVVVLVGGLKIKTLGMLLPEAVMLPDWLAIPLTLLVMVGVTNAINLADGLDGLAGGICLLSLGCLGYLAYLEGDTLVTLLALSLAGSIFGFLRFNTYPATVFMGDTGSELIGFSIIALALNMTQGNTPLSPLLPLLIVGFPLLDTAATMVRRALNRSPLFIADKSHLHHKLLGLGLFHTEAVFAIYMMQAAFVIAALAFRFHSDWSIVSVFAFMSLVILGGLALAERKQWRLNRQGIFDRAIKGRLRVLKEGLKARRVFIRGAFAIVRFGLPALLVVACFLPGTVPGSFAAVCALAGGVIVLGHLARKSWGKWPLVITLYLFIPFIVFLGETEKASWFINLWPKLYNMSYAAMALFVVLTLRWTGRRQGFRITPMDFLIMFIAGALSLLPEGYSQQYHLGAVATRIVVLFFAYEVLMGELRGELGPVAWATAGALFLVAARGLVGV